MNKKLIIGIIGSAVLLIGVFAPVIALPIIGNLNYFQNSKMDSTILMFLGIASLALTFLKRYKWLLLTSIGSIGVMIYSFTNFKIRAAKASSMLEPKLIDDPFRELGRLSLHFAQLQWGWAVLLAGAVLIIVAAVMNKNTAIAPRAQSLSTSTLR